MSSSLTTNQILFKEAQSMGLKPRMETDYGLFSVEKLNHHKKQINQNSGDALIDSQISRQYFFYGHFKLNSLRGHVLAKNKHFTRLVLEQHNLSDVPYILPQDRVELGQFFAKYKPIICKPLLGQRSENIFLVKTKKKLDQCALKGNFFEKYLTGVEYRYLVLKDQVIAVQKKELQPIKNKPWNLFYTGLEQKEWNQAVSSRAVQIAKVLGLGWAGVDFIINKQGDYSMLEVNSVPGIAKMHYPDEGVSFNVARKILQAELSLD